MEQNKEGEMWNRTKIVRKKDEKIQSDKEYQGVKWNGKQQNSVNGIAVTGI